MARIYSVSLNSILVSTEDLGRCLTLCDFVSNQVNISAISSDKVFVVHLEHSTTHLLVISLPTTKPSSSDPPALQTSLAVYHSLLKLIGEHTSVPHPIPLYFSDTLDIIPYEYLILTHPPGIPLSEL